MKPQLLETTELGGTVHTYPLSGGQSTFVRYLSCYLGNCAFFNEKEDAVAYLAKIEPAYCRNI